MTTESDQWGADVQKAAQAAADRTRKPLSELIKEASAESFQDPEPDGLYDKYRIFKEPQDDGGLAHPVPIYGPYQVPPSINPNNYIEGEALSIGFRSPLEEVQDFVFVLKPDHDRHARVALAAYAWSCMDEKPALAEDLLQVLNDH